MIPYLVHVRIFPPRTIRTPYIGLDTTGLLRIAQRYAWDGPSGPVVHTRTFLRASLVHDALYQLMRASLLDATGYRKPADRLLRQMCRADGMSWLRAGYVYLAVRLFGAAHARPAENRHSRLKTAP